MCEQCHQVHALHFLLVPTTQDGNWQALQWATVAAPLTLRYVLHYEYELIDPNHVHGMWNQRT
jgi:hypothetical protein